MFSHPDTALVSVIKLHLILTGKKDDLISLIVD